MRVLSLLVIVSACLAVAVIAEEEGGIIGHGRVGYVSPGLYGPSASRAYANQAHARNAANSRHAHANAANRYANANAARNR